MTLQWLGQEPLNLIAGHYYRARFLMPVSTCPITDTVLGQVKTMLNGLGSKTASDWESWGWSAQWKSRAVVSGWAVQKTVDSSFDGFPPSPWPGNMREVPPALNPKGLCPVWAWAKAKQDVTIPPAAIRGVLAPIGLLNLWEASSGQVIYDATATGVQVNPGMSLLPGGGGAQVSPGMSLLPGGGQAPLPSNLLPGGGQVSPGLPQPGGGQTQPVVTEKKTSPVVYVVAGALAIGAIYLVTRVA